MAAKTGAWKKQRQSPAAIRPKKHKAPWQPQNGLDPDAGVTGGGPKACAIPPAAPENTGKQRCRPGEGQGRGAAPYLPPPKQKGAQKGADDDEHWKPPAKFYDSAAARKKPFAPHIKPSPKGRVKFFRLFNAVQDGGLCGGKPQKINPGIGGRRAETPGPKCARRRSSRRFSQRWPHGSGTRGSKAADPAGCAPFIFAGGKFNGGETGFMPKGRACPICIGMEGGSGVRRGGRARPAPAGRDRSLGAVPLPGRIAEGRREKAPRPPVWGRV